MVGNPVSDPGPSRAAAAEKAAGRRWRRLLGAPELGLGAVIVVLALAAAGWAGSEKRTIRERGPDGSMVERQVSRNRLLNADVLVNYAKDASFVGIMAVGATIVIISLGIDLSVGSVYALAGVAGAMVLHHFGPLGAGASVNPWLGAGAGVAASLGVALMCGLINGVAVVGLRVHPFIITLGTMLIFRGAAFVATKAQSIGDFPALMTALIKSDLGLGGGLQPVPMLVMIGVAAVGAIHLGATVGGRRVYAVGGNLEAARFSGLPTQRVLVGVYVAAALCAGVAAVAANGLYGSANCIRGEGYELKVIAAAVVGGASLTGGRGTAIGAVLGALLIQLIEQSIITLQIDQNYNQIVIGFAIIIAVALDQASSRARAKRFAAAAGARAEGPRPSNA